MTAFLNQLALSFDLPVLNWIHANLRCPLLDKLMPIITLFGEGGVFWIAWAVILLIIPKTRKIGISMLFALTLGLLVCNVTLKPLIARIRPYELQEQMGVTVELLIARLEDFSFPSGHTIASFEAAVVLLKYSKKMGIPALIIAIAVSFSRLYLHVHYPSDVLASIVLGTAFAFLGCALANLIKLPSTKKGKFERD
ncbi:MAG TPA: phosphatase PAP2 family protein [Clostridiales bacterium]|nr:phosphatase PAP2 family protein [Clostridiales bacterium]HCI63742.1 phosphatase PAP2 family protein [Clostridiales bacterium]